MWVSMGPCSAFAMQFKMRYELLLGAFDDNVREKDVVEGERAQSYGKLVLEGEVNALHYVKALTMYRNETPMTLLKQIVVAECATYFWLNHLPAGEMLGCVDHMGVRTVGSAHPGFTSVVSDVVQISTEGAVYRNNVTENGWQGLMKPEQKSIALMKDLVMRFLKCVDLPLDECA